MLKDDITIIDELVNDSDDFRCGYGPAWERIKKFVEEAQNSTSTNTPTNKQSESCLCPKCGGSNTKGGWFLDNQVCECGHVWKK